MVKSVHWIGIEVHDSPWYDKTNNLDWFLKQMDSITKEYCMDVLDITLKGTLVKWWEPHKNGTPHI